MRSIPRLLLGLLLLVAFGVDASAVAATTTLNLTGADGAALVNKVQTAATINSTENIVTVQIASKPRTVCFVADTAWIYRSAASGTDFKVASGQTLTLEFTATTTFYHVRQSADGTLSSIVVK